jgi:uncharacterized protein (TIGR03085 family)
VTSWAAHERAALLEALRALGPDAPTLCDGWATRDMAAHIYVRERRPDAALGVLPLGPLSAYTDRVMASVLRVQSYDDLLRRLRRAPAYVRLTGLDDVINTVEFFVHTEDVRRANDLPLRELPPALEQVLGSRLRRQARVLFRRAGARVRLVPAPGDPIDVGSGDETVEVRGRPGEVLLFGFNRKAAARVDLVGTGAAVAALQQARLGL